MRTSRIRRADVLSLVIVWCALSLLCVVGARTAYARSTLVVMQSQAVINQRQSDRLESLDTRVAHIETEVVKLPALVERLDRAVSDIGQIGTREMSVFVALVLNLIATLVQIKTQRRRRESEREA